MTVAVLGLGPMGRGIAQVFAAAGATVRVVDATPERTREEFARLTEEAGDDPGHDRMTPVDDLAAALDGADLLVEAIAEDPELKHRVLADIAAHAADNLVVASNTSSLSIGQMGAAYGRADRVLGLHFFNPPTKMALVEVVRGPGTDPARIDQAVRWVEQLGKTAVVCADSPNFVVNRVCRPLYYEAQMLVTQGLAPATVDAAARAGLGHRVGPLELVDRIGLHTHLASSETAHREFGDPRYRPIPLVRQLVRAGWTGRAAGRGFYDYQAQPPREARGAVTHDPPAGGRPVVAGPRTAPAVTLDAADTPDAVVVYRAVAATEADVAAVTRLVLDGRDIAVDSSDDRWRDHLTAGAGWLRLHSTFAEVVTDPVAGIGRTPGVDAVLAAVGASSVEVLALPGLVVDRLGHCLINEAATLVEEGGATPDDVDTALKLGMNHPIGPFELLGEHTAAVVVASLRAMQADSGDPRYRPASLLLRRAAAEDDAA